VTERQDDREDRPLRSRPAGKPPPDRLDGELEDTLRSGNRRLGRARRRVAEALVALDRPVTAAELAATIPDVHPTSVYRSLAVLEQLGVARHIHLAHGPALYAPAERAARTRHAVCEICGRVIEIPVAVFDQLVAHVQQEHGFVLDSDHFALTGHCRACASRHRGGGRRTRH
jgi:Fe2+ or Zn2+ uptake regulation protein